MTEDSIQRILTALATNEEKLRGVSAQVKEVRDSLEKERDNTNIWREAHIREQKDVHGRLSNFSTRLRTAESLLEENKELIRLAAENNAINKGVAEQKRLGTDASVKIIAILVTVALAAITIASNVFAWILRNYNAPN